MGFELHCFESLKSHTVSLTVSETAAATGILTDSVCQIV
jgi:hypothetical protein